MGGISRYQRKAPFGGRVHSSFILAMMSAFGSNCFPASIPISIAKVMESILRCVWAFFFREENKTTLARSSTISAYIPRNCRDAISSAGSRCRPHPSSETSRFAAYPVYLPLTRGRNTRDSTPIGCYPLAAWVPPFLITGLPGRFPRRIRPPVREVYPPKVKENARTPGVWNSRMMVPSIARSKWTRWYSRDSRTAICP
jgi:hypothetical protein